MNFNSNDSRFMARAIQLAKRGWYTTRTNPRVGCVIVNNSPANEPQVIGQGWHAKPGLAHAEVNAILDANRLGHSTKGATAYVTLEPCSHTGRTPPCASALISAGVTKVVCAMTDPNPQVSGRGIEMLQQQGAVVEVGLMEQEAQALNPGFIKRMTLGVPRVTAKVAMSVDGRTAMESGESQWITGPDARANVQQLRAESGAIITGSGTVIADNPSMTVRDERFIASQHFEQPLRVIIDSKQQIKADAQILHKEGTSWLVTTGPSDLELPPSVTNQVIRSKDGFADITELLKLLGNAGVNDVLLEAGNELVGAFFEYDLIDELIVFMAPKLMGSLAKPLANLPFKRMSQAINLELRDVRQIGQDLKLTYNRVG